MTTQRYNPEWSERQFRAMIIHGTKSSTYKFAFAKFLLDYCEKSTTPSVHVKISTISEYFIQIFWPQILQTKLAHTPTYTKKGGLKQLEIVDIIKNEFPEVYYPHSYKYYKTHEKIKIQKCIDEITNRCFNDVIWRFQKINNRELTRPPFFKYKVKPKWTNPNKKKTDLTFGIHLNPKFINFVRRRYISLNDLVILEWAKFLEKYNHGVPLIIQKLNGEKIKRNTSYANKAKTILGKHCKKCFYCNKTLDHTKKDKTQLEHVIPFNYITEDNIWNYRLSCQKCNCYKLGALPQKLFISKLIKKLKDERKKIPMLDNELNQLGKDFGNVIMNHYVNAKKVGYMPKKMPPKIP